MGELVFPPILSFRFSCYSMDEIAERLSIAKGTISNSLFKNGKLSKNEQPEGLGKPQTSSSCEKEEKLIIDLYLQCKPFHEITKQTALSKGRISQIVNNFKNEKIKQSSKNDSILNDFPDKERTEN